MVTALAHMRPFLGACWPLQIRVVCRQRECVYGVAAPYSGSRVDGSQPGPCATRLPGPLGPLGVCGCVVWCCSQHTVGACGMKSAVALEPCVVGVRAAFSTDKQGMSTLWKLV